MLFVCFFAADVGTPEVGARDHVLLLEAETEREAGEETGPGTAREEEGVVTSNGDGK